PTSPATPAWPSWWGECSPCINSSPIACTPHEKTALASGLIEATDGQTDALVYELYGLTEEEIGIAEEADKG
ncbi:MAG: hypothetical protein PHY05_02505, partial [Methanothrix sp.]|nr:hypothetical protein [Methanothrix sp.]